MNSSKVNQMRMFEKSMNWCQKESEVLNSESEKFCKKVEKGLISSEDAISELRLLENRIDYIYKKTDFEYKNYVIFLNKCQD